MTRTQHIEAIADKTRSADGVAVMASVQTLPETDRPYKLRGVSNTPKTRRYVTLSLTPDEARKAVSDWVSMGLRP